MPRGATWRAEPSPLDGFKFVEIQDVHFVNAGTLSILVSVRQSPRKFSLQFDCVCAFAFSDEYFDDMSGQTLDAGDFSGPGRLHSSTSTPRSDHFSRAVQPAFAEHAADRCEFYFTAMTSRVTVICQGGYRVEELTAEIQQELAS